MKTKKVRVVAVIASVVWLVFIVSLTLFFTKMNSRVYIIMTLSSGFIGLVLYCIFRMMIKEKSYIALGEEQEPDSETGSDPEAEGDIEHRQATSAEGAAEPDVDSQEATEADKEADNA